MLNQKNIGHKWSLGIREIEIVILVFLWGLLKHDGFFTRQKIDF